MTILVTGATGNVGRAVVSQLLEAGVSVRATSRNPQTADLPVEVHAADLGDPGSFDAALTGVEKVFLFPNPAGASGFAELAKAKGVKQIVLLSSQAAAHEEFGDSPIRTMHLAVEQAVAKSGIDWTFLRPGGFAANTLAWAPSIVERGEVRMPFPESEANSIHEADIAAVAVKALLEDGHAGAAYELTGPESITQRRQVEVIAAAIGREITVVVQDRAEAKAALREQFGDFANDKMIESLLGMQEATVGRPAGLSDAVEKVLGRPARPFAEWVADHKADFTA
ncbi:NAD(P)H-binding protein [Kibdelosporangium persicum]|uniref:Nucleotide-diphosphate-sugar epimerase n=1 Tax=Kibdelosporangium persicum TaxID=2698649 RepID=A0ABX2FJN4_9PSEU|nr:NAD(P)H-binding protein [Kibdelosporangium persicum]NRN70935.1 Nucleotide-diphosphate-sugar epimerase [Kibdelosporangium persicum]